MSILFNIGICLVLLVLQTAIMPCLPLLNGFYDLLIPFVVYLSIARPVREGVPFVLLFGFIMDNLSGAPFGVYLTTYFWLFFGVKAITAFIQVGNRVGILTLIITVGVLFENLIVLGALAVLGGKGRFAGDAAGIITGQTLWALFTGSMLLLFIKNANNRVGSSLKAFHAAKSEQLRGHR